MKNNLHLLLHNPTSTVPPSQATTTQSKLVPRLKVFQNGKPIRKKSVRTSQKQLPTAKPHTSLMQQRQLTPHQTTTLDSIESTSSMIQSLIQKQAMLTIQQQKHQTSQRSSCSNQSVRRTSFKEKPSASSKQKYIGVPAPRDMPTLAYLQNFSSMLQSGSTTSFQKRGQQPAHQKPQ